MNGQPAVAVPVVSPVADGAEPDPGRGGALLLQPDPGGTIQSLSSLGYSPAAAVADLIDNSLAVGASQIDVSLHWDGSTGSTVSVRDNGTGMIPAVLMEGMTVGGRGLAPDREAGDLGRFGMGLKTASFSQCRQLIVATRTRVGEWSTAVWDVDHVIRVGEWELLTDVPADARADLDTATAPSHSGGTVILWRRLTRLVPPDAGAGERWAHDEFLAGLRGIEQHLSMVFARYLTRQRNPVGITLNGRPLRGWDPFLGSQAHVVRLPAEQPRAGVSVQGFVLPHRNRFTGPDGRTPDPAAYDAAGGPRGWLEQQGFYVYRRDRLIVAGDWLGLKNLRRDEQHVLARLVVDVGTDQDSDWAVDVRKSSATPPLNLVAPLSRIARATRERAAAALRSRGKPTRNRQTVSADAMWQGMNEHGRTSFRINRDHPLARAVLAGDRAGRPAVLALLRLIEQTIPTDQIRMLGGDEEIEPPGQPATGQVPPAVVLDMARQVLVALMADGSSRSVALARIAHMPPFNDYPGLVDDLARDLGGPRP